jgi:cytochrome P450
VLGVDELARRYVDHMLEIGPECDFVTEVAVNYPGYVILSLLGLPEDDYPLIQRLTNELFGTDDPEYQRGSRPKTCSTSSATSSATSVGRPPRNATIPPTI